MPSYKERPTAGRGLFYTRDSGGRHETTPAQYLGWAQTVATRQGIRLSGTAADIEEMFKTRAPQRGDLFFDVDVSGNKFDRPALTALLRELERDHEISHVFIPRRDRLARPDREEEGIALENRIRELGVTIEFQNRTLAPIKRSIRGDIAEKVQALFEYGESGKFRDDHAEKMIWAKLALAQKGHSTGGRPPFGFRRFLIGPDGQVVRQLADGEKVRQSGHHVDWRPGPKEELDLIHRIVSMLESMPASRVARTLTQEGIPAPDANRMRRDNGVPHLVSGVWHQTTIVNIARNPLLRAMVEFGRRGMGDRRRVTPEGPRPVEHDDLRADGKPKVTQQPHEVRIVAKASFEPVLDSDVTTKLDRILDARGASQRGKPRSRDPERNPLGGRIFDIDCGWPMYRASTGQSYDYRCGLYMQSHGQACQHNHVSGPATVQFVLEFVRQRFQLPEMVQKLGERIQSRLREREASTATASEAVRAAGELAAAESRAATIGRNMSVADTPAQLAAMKQAFNEAGEAVERLKRQVAKFQASQQEGADKEKVLQQALEVLAQLPELVKDPTAQGGISALLQSLDVRIFLKFTEEKKKKRTVNALSGGVVTMGAAPPPISPYSGPTSRRAVKKPSEMSSEGPHSAEENESLGNVSRGDRI